MFTAHNLDDGSRVQFRDVGALLRRTGGRSVHFRVVTAPQYARPGKVALRVTRGNGTHAATLSIPASAWR